MTEHERLLAKRARLQALGAELKKLPPGAYYKDTGWHVCILQAIAGHCLTLVEASLIREMTA